MIMTIRQNAKKAKIDWEKLDNYWAETYESDYGHLFNTSSGDTFHTFISGTRQKVIVKAPQEIVAV